MVHARPKWDVDRFLKNSGNLFTGDTNLDVAIDWFDGTKVVFDQMGCAPELWVLVVVDLWSRIDVVEICLVCLPWRLSIKAYFLGGILGSLLQSVYLLNSGRGEEDRVHNPNAGGHVNGREPHRVPGIEEICTRLLPDCEPEGLRCCVGCCRDHM